MRRLLELTQAIAGFIDRWQWLVLILFAPAFLFPSPGRVILLAALPLLWLATLVAGRKPAPVTPINASLLLMAVMVLVSLFATYDLSVSLPKVSGMLLGFAAFFLVVRMGATGRGWWLCLLAFVLVSLGVTLVSLLGTAWFSNKFIVIGKLVSLLPKLLSGLPGASEGFHPNEVAGALIWPLPVTALVGLVWLLEPSAMKTARRGKVTWLAAALALAVAGLITIVLLLTQSRSAMLGLFVALVAVAWLLLPKVGRWLMASVILLCLLALGVLIYLYPGQTSQLVGLNGAASSVVTSAAGGTFSLNTMNGRLEVWSRAIYGIQDFPLTGMGMNTFRYVVKVLYPLFTVGADFDLGHAHNEFLQAALDLGIPGLIAFIGVYIGAFSMLASTWIVTKRLANSPVAANRPSIVLTRYLALGLGGGLLAHMVYGLTDTVALGAKPGLLYWMLLGLIVGLYFQVRQNGFIRWPFHAGNNYH